MRMRFGMKLSVLAVSALIVGAGAVSADTLRQALTKAYNNSGLWNKIALFCVPRMKMLHKLWQPCVPCSIGALGSRITSADRYRPSRGLGEYG